LSRPLAIDFVRDTLHMSEPEAATFLRSLRKAGFLKRGKDGLWDLTTEGIRLRGATAAKPLLRRTAERLLEDLRQRMTTLNEDPRFLTRVEEAIVFGSYLADKDRLGDVDVAVHLVSRLTDPLKHREANDRRVSDEEHEGRRFSSIIDRVFWWQQEAMLFLRNRRRGLSLHDYELIKEIVEGSPHARIFPNPESNSAFK
jgi:predicted nucleotidyltransferase